MKLKPLQHSAHTWPWRSTGARHDRHCGGKSQSSAVAAALPKTSPRREKPVMAMAEIKAGRGTCVKDRPAPLLAAEHGRGI